jgi:hypothetical protein
MSGSPATYEGQQLLIAATVKKDQEVLELRDSRGFPRWMGWRPTDR